MSKTAGATAVVGPVLIGASAIVLSQRPSMSGYVLAVAVILAVVAADVVVVVTRQRRTAVAANLLHGALLVFLTTYCASPLSRPAPLSDALPRASPPPGLAVYRIPTGVIHHTAAFGYRGARFSRGGTSR